MKMFAFCVFATLGAALANDNGLALTPPMGMLLSLSPPDVCLV